jgi:acyl-coenzyme A synthetase/AMP-(fatty) acid ligase
MKRAVICVENPELQIPQYQDYSIMVVNPATSPQRLKYLLDNSDYSLLVTNTEIFQRPGGNYNEAALWYTSGTTGDSKFYSFSQQQLDHLANTICQEYEITNNDRYLSIMPLWHAHGLGLYWAAKKADCEVKYIKPPELRNNIDYSPTIISAIPDFLKLFTKQAFSDLRFVRSASSALPTKLYNDLVAWSGKPVIEAFGMTEACSHCFTNPLHGEQRIGTVGLPSGVDARIVNGQLEIQGSSVYKSGWFATGDIAEQDERGYYKIVGRLQDRINVRGYKIDPLSVENQLYINVPNIGHVAVFGKDRVMCVYTGSVSEQQVRQAMIDIDYHCSPRLVQRIESIPLNNAGKVSRSMLTELYK